MRGFYSLAWLGPSGKGQVCEPLTVLLLSHLASSSDEASPPPCFSGPGTKQEAPAQGWLSWAGVPSKLSKLDRFITLRVAGQLVCDQLLVKGPVPVSRGPLTLGLKAGIWYHMRVSNLPRHVFVGG
jgi:hypothetical protein